MFGVVNGDVYRSRRLIADLDGIAQFAVVAGIKLAVSRFMHLLRIDDLVKAVRHTDP